MSFFFLCALIIFFMCFTKSNHGKVFALCKILFLKLNLVSLSNTIAADCIGEG